MDAHSCRLLLVNLFEQHSVEIQLPLQRNLCLQLQIPELDRQNRLCCRGELAELEAKPRGPEGFWCVLHLAAPMSMFLSCSEALQSVQIPTSGFVPKASWHSWQRTRKLFQNCEVVVMNISQVCQIVLGTTQHSTVFRKFSMCKITACMWFTLGIPCETFRKVLSICLI